MNCCECEQLFDAYLDGGLAGSLRLEFDAHRLRCRRCQQTLAMLETVGHVIASDPQMPALSDDFTERVMHKIVRTPKHTTRIPLRRVAVVGAAVLQAAAVLTFALLWTGRPADDAAPAPAPVVNVAGEWDHGDPGYDAVLGEIIEGVEDQLWDMHAAGTKLTAEVAGLARYLNITVPEDVMRESQKVTRVNPWQSVWDVFNPPAEDEPQPAGPASDVHSI